MWRVAGKALPGEVEGFVDATSEEVGVSIQPSGVCLEPLDVSPVVGGQAEIAEHVVEGTVLHDKHHDGVDQVERGHGSPLLDRLSRRPHFAGVTDDASISSWKVYAPTCFTRW